MDVKENEGILGNSCSYLPTIKCYIFHLVDFADDIEEITQAQEVLSILENEAAKVGLYCNSDKTKYQAFNQDHDQHHCLVTNDGEDLKEVKNFKYLGSWMESSEKDIRKALAWSAYHKLRKIWSSKLPRKLKVRLFIATVESVLLYGAETWTLAQKLQKKLDGCYTRMLRMAMNVTWKQHSTNDQLYQNLPRVSQKIQQRRMRIAGHCIRHNECPASQLVLWQSTNGRRKRGRKNISYVDNLMDDTEMVDIVEIKSSMMDRNGWRERISSLRRPRGHLK